MEHRYIERVGQLLSDGYLMNDRSADVRLTSKGVAKLHDLIHEGYMIMASREDNVRLTNKGVAVLLACADRPARPRREIKRVPVQRK
jgi:hypothetical protein